MFYKQAHSEERIKIGEGLPSNDGRNISIVVQGAYSDITLICLSSFRKIFPNAEIILSTWQNSEVSSPDADRIIFSDDPGTVFADKVAKTLNNVNRQLVSTKAGLAAATRQFVLKTRSDVVFHNGNFITYFGKYDGIQSPYFQNRLLICNYYTRNPRISHICFHPSDWLLFGTRSDILQYYETIPCMSESEAGWFETRKKASAIFTNYLCRFTPEQHIFLSFINKYQPVDCNCYYDFSCNLAQRTERAFADCFVVLDYQKHWAISFSKYDPNRYLEKYTLISHWQWRAIYGHYYRRGPALGWWCYRIRIFLFALLMLMRKTCVRILDFWGIKELVKKVLSSRGNNSNHLNNN